MKPTNKYLNETLDRVTAEIRNEEPDPAAVANAADRVWARISAEPAEAGLSAAPSGQIRNCEDFQSLIPAYLSGSLTDARALLLEDHTHECIPCRKALKAAKTGSAPSKPVAMPGAQRSFLTRRPVVRWAIAATVVLALGITTMIFSERFSRSTDAFRAIASIVNGPVYVVADTETRPIQQGEQIKTGEEIRIAKDAGAVVTLPDGSEIETKERSEFSISEGSEGVTIHLDRGNIIVQAAKQRSRHLFVATKDCLVSVTGTIFSVNSGTKGARVSVVEGEVHVDYAGKKRVLHPGEQVSTTESIEPVPVKEEVAWSRNSTRYNALLAEAAELRKELDARVSMPEVRYSTSLLDRMPEGTVLYAAIPNLSATLKESSQIIEERLQQNADLREWWEGNQTAGGRPGFKQVVNKVSEFGEYLGNEMVVSARLNANGEPDGPLVLAELTNPVAFRAYLDQQIAAIGAGEHKGPGIRIVDDPLTATTTSDEKGQSDLFVWINDSLVAASPRLELLQQLATSLKSSGANPFLTSSFHASIAGLYSEGAGFIVAADLEKILSQSLKGAAKSGEAKEGEAKEGGAFQQLGLQNLKHFIVEMKIKDGQPQNRAVLSFDPASKGITSWLAEPGPMGALGFISPDANVVAAFVVKQPVSLVDDLLGAMNTVDPNIQQIISGFERSSGIDIRNDIAAPLGGEFAFAVDGPLLPTPSWKMVFEVNDPAHLQQTFERVVDRLNAYARMVGKSGLEWDREEIGGRTFYTLKSAQVGAELNYTYADGYLIAAPSRALVDRAIRYHESGYTLVHSPRFIAALPEDRNPNFSAFVYQNLTSMIGSVAGRVGGASGKMSEDKQAALKSLTDAAPVLAYAYAYGDRIVFSANSEGKPFALTPGTLMSLPFAFGPHASEDESK